MPNTDSFNLQRFVDAQSAVFAEVQAELKAGVKTSHWMWFIFPQIQGLGTSGIAKRYAIASRDEAKAYLEHPVLGLRLKSCARLALAVEGKSSVDIFGHIDSLKFRSSMTLFAEVSPGDPIFSDALKKYFGGEPDVMTLRLLGRS